MIISPKNGPELLSVIRGIDCGAQFVCSMRLHVLIYAACAARPMIGLSLDPKIDAFIAANAGERNLFKIPDFDADMLTEAMSAALEDSESRRAGLETAAEHGRALASDDIERVLELMH